MTAEQNPQASVDALYDGLSALLRASRRERQRWSDAHPGLPVGLLGLLNLVDRLAAGAPGSTPVTGCRLKDLAATAGLDASTVSREIAQLIARGLVERRSDPADGRAARLALTPAGHELLARMQAALVDRLTLAVRSWDAADVDAFTTALHRFADALGDRGTAEPRVPSPATPDRVPSLEAS